MNILITGAWQDAQRHIVEIENMGHEVCFMQYEKDELPCDYDWIVSLREQCVKADVAFRFHQTGAHFVREGRRYEIARHLQRQQARKSGLDFMPRGRKAEIVLKDIEGEQISLPI